MDSDLLSDIRREIDDRLVWLRPAVEEYEQLLAAAEAVEQEAQAANGAGVGRGSPEMGRRSPEVGLGSAVRRAGATVDTGLREAILGALEHGSHTVAELTVVTAAGTASINRELRRLDAEGLVAKTSREGKLAWSSATGD